VFGKLYFKNFIPEILFYKSCYGNFEKFILEDFEIGNLKILFSQNKGGHFKITKCG